MATANHITSTANAPTTRREYYSSISEGRRIEAALEMIREIGEEMERHYVLASTLVLQLKPNVGDDPVDSVALRLAEVLEKMLTEHGQYYRLIDCLEVMQSDLQKAAEVCHE